MSAQPRLPSTTQLAPYGTTNNAGRRRPRPSPNTILRGAAQGLEHTNDRALDAVQRRAADGMQQAKAAPIVANGQSFIAGIKCTASTPVTVAHNLVRAFVSCVLCGQSAAGSIAVQRPSTLERPPSQQNMLDQRQITFTPSFTGTCDLLVW